MGGLGIAYVSYWEVGEDLAAGRLVQMFDAWTPPYPGLCLYYPGRRHVPAGLKARVALVQEQASARRESAARLAHARQSRQHPTGPLPTGSSDCALV